jgi:hypothetical protein
MPLPLKEDAMKTTINTLTALIAAATPALAASGAESEGNGFLVTLFLAFGALVIALQLIPGLLLFGSMIRGIFSKPAEESADKHHAA